ncbi:MAG TPA: hypothetical protein PLO56_15305 [Rhodothermales bacterium]|nr:hypothetical protein [Rhodothermales bacterium]
MMLFGTLLLCLMASATQIQAQRDRDTRGRDDRGRNENPRDRYNDRNRYRDRDDRRYGDVYFHNGRWVGESRYNRSDWHGRYDHYRHHRSCTARHCVRTCRYFGWNYRGHHPSCRHQKCVRSCRYYRKPGLLFRIFN